MASRASRPPASSASSSRKSSSSTWRRKRDDLRIRADHVRDVQQRQAHLRRDVAGGGQRQRVGRVLLAQPRLQLLVEPPRGLHPGHERLEAQRVGQEPLQLLDVGQDEVEQRRPGLRPDVALQGGDGSLAAPDQLGDDGRIGLDRGRRGAGRRPAATVVRDRRDEVAAVEDRLQRVPDQRVLPEGLQDGGAGRRRGQARGDVDEQPSAGLVHPRDRDQLVHGEPQGLHGVGHHLLVTDGDVDVVLPVVGRGDGEQRGDRPALDDLEAIVDQAPLDVLGAAEVRFDPPAQPHEPHDLRIRQRRLSCARSIASCVPPAGGGMAAVWRTALATISPSRTV